MAITIKTVKAATAIIRNSKGEFLLLKRSRVRDGFWGYWQLVEGKVDKGETTKEALIRETQEEIGQKITIGKHIGTFEVDVKVLAIGFHVVREVYEGKVKGEVKLSHEHTAYRWLPKNEALKLKLVPGLKEIISSRIL